MANSFSELNDAEDQAERFMQQVREKDADNDEAMHYNTDFVRALEYGLPPTAGQSIKLAISVRCRALLQDKLKLNCKYPLQN